MTYLSFVYLIAGAALLMLAGDALVRGAMGISLRSGLSATFVSLTVVALGTSLPELLVSVQAALQGSPGIALGNVIGSNMANILLILGVPALILVVQTDAAEHRRNVLLMLVATIAFAAVAWSGEISRLAGVAFLIALVGIITISIKLSKSSGNAGESSALTDDIDPSTATETTNKLLAYLGFGVIGLPIGAYCLIEGARDIALAAGLSESAVGLTVIALGTSLPELAASVAAALRGRTDMIMGNVIGSNLMNILAIIGVTSIISPLDTASELLKLDLISLVAISAILALIVLAGWRIGRILGVGFLLGYGAFVWLALSHTAG